MGSLSNNNSNSKKERPKSNQFILAELQLCMCITLFCTFLSHHCKSATWNLLISLACFMELVSTAQNFLFLFLNQIRSYEVWNSANWIFKWCFLVCCHPEILLPYQLTWWILVSFEDSSLGLKKQFFIS